MNAIVVTVAISGNISCCALVGAVFNPVGIERRSLAPPGIFQLFRQSARGLLSPAKKTCSW